VCHDEKRQRIQTFRQRDVTARFVQLRSAEFPSNTTNQTEPNERKSMNNKFDELTKSLAQSVAAAR
jgi:hypothetical protein